MDNIITNLFNLTFAFAIKLLAAIIIAIVGVYLIKFILKLCRKIFLKHNFDISLSQFLISLIKILLYITLAIIVVSTLGIQTSSLVVMLGTFGLAIGLALQGSLSNFAGGVLILIFKPFKVGDTLIVDSQIGEVKGINILYTIIYTPDNRVITVPNGVLANNKMENTSQNSTRRVDLKVQISYKNDIDKAKNIIFQVLEKDLRILTEPQKAIVVTNLNSSGIDLAVRVWVNTKDYWDVFSCSLENIKSEFDKNNITIPPQQLDVHLVS